jgi:hypothetical protein
MSNAQYKADNGKVGYMEQGTASTKLATSDDANVFT